jgi:hypothetical protein
MVYLKTYNKNIQPSKLGLNMLDHGEDAIIQVHINKEVLNLGNRGFSLNLPRSFHALLRIACTDKDMAIGEFRELES